MVVSLMRRPRSHIVSRYAKRIKITITFRFLIFTIDIIGVNSNMHVSGNPRWIQFGRIAYLHLIHAESVTRASHYEGGLEPEMASVSYCARCVCQRHFDVIAGRLTK